MELKSCLASFTLFLVLLSNGAVYGVGDGDDFAIQRTLIQKLDDIQNQFSSVADSIRTLDQEIINALDNCLGLSTEQCQALQAENSLKSRPETGSLFGLAKRFAHADDPDVSRYRGVYKELKRKRAMVNYLKKMVSGADNVLRNERKRSCDVNLGFHCNTEDIIEFADMYDYLASNRSPGKKRSLRGTS